MAFQKFLKLPRSAQHSRVTLSPHPSTPATAAAPEEAGRERGGAGAGRTRLWGRSTAPERQARPRGLGDLLPSPTSGKAQEDRFRTAPAAVGRGGGEEGPGGGGEGRGGGEEERPGRGARPHYQGSCAELQPRDYLKWT